MQTVSMRRMSSSRAMMAAGTRPPRVMATMPCHWPPTGPCPIRRQASALAVRCSSSQLPGKVLGCEEVMRGDPWKADLCAALSAPPGERQAACGICGFVAFSAPNRRPLRRKMHRSDVLVLGAHQIAAADPPGAVGLLLHGVVGEVGEPVRP